MHLKQVIECAGYTKNEARVYLAALEIGGGTVTDIADKSGLPRTTCLLAIRALQECGLVSYYVRLRRKFWVAENPQRLLSRTEEQQTLLRNALPKLQAMQRAAVDQPQVRVFRGLKETKCIFDDIIDTKHHVRSITAVELVLSLFDDIFRDFIARRHLNHLRVQLLTNPSPFVEYLRNNDEKELRETRLLPEGITLTNATFIYGGKTAIVSLSKSMPSGIIIDEPAFSATQEDIFRYLWEKSAPAPRSGGTDRKRGA